MKITVVQSELKVNYIIEVHKQKAYRAKTLALSRLGGDYVSL